jgi:RimJ/RimL family protein N-acetyltransferase
VTSVPTDGPTRAISRTLRLATPRLSLCPTTVADFPRALAVRSNWHVTRNLSSAAFPPDAAHMQAWFAGHEQEWLAGTAYRFAIRLEDRFIGMTDLSDVEGSEAELGYWTDEAIWGHGYGFEAVQAIIAFAFDTIGLAAVRADYVADNAASARILSKLAFQPVGETLIQSKPRGTEVLQRHYRLQALLRPPVPAALLRR